MKKYFIFLWFCLSSSSLTHVVGQEWNYPGKDSLSYYFNHHDFSSYFRLIDSISKSAVEKKDVNTIFEFGEMLQHDFGDLNQTERWAIRFAAIRVAKGTWKLTGLVDQSLIIYLVAHENVENKITLDTLAWYAENDISNLYTRKGDYEKADYFSKMVEASLKYFQMPNRLSRLYTNWGTRLLSELKYNEAKEIFKKGYVLADSNNYESGIVANSLGLASIYNDTRDLDSSAIYLQIASEHLPKLISNKNNYLDKKSGLEFEFARWNLLQKKYSESIHLFKRHIQTLSEYYVSKNRREFAKAYTSLAKAYLLYGALDSAAQAIQLGLTCLIPDLNPALDFPSHDQLYAENSFIDLFDAKAQYYQKLDSLSTDNAQLENALTSIELGLYVNDILRETFLADPSKLVSIQSNKKLIGNGISILYQLSSRGNSLEYFDEARSFFNRSKSILYNEKNQRNRMVELMTDEDKSNWKSLMNKKLELHESKRNTQADINAINGEILRCQEQIDSIFSKYNEVQLATSFPEQYVEYFMGEKEIFGMSVLNHQKIFTRIGTRTTFQSLMNRLNNYLDEKRSSMDDTIQHDLFTLLIKPISQHLPDHVVIIPDGTIGLVPFEMLKDDEGKYLIEYSTIAYAFEYMTYLPVQDPPDKKSEVYCLAPQYPVKAGKEKEVTRGSIYHLPFAKMEVDSIQNLFGDLAMTSQSADKSEWEKNISGISIFHYAGHAIIRGDQSFLAFDSQGDEKLQLTGTEISMMHHPLDLVVLSACETGLGKIEQGEGIRSLGRSFMEAGAQSTIISLWNVNDKSTAFIMTDFYKHLKAGMTKDEALRQAKLNYLQNASTQYTHPYFWAAFIPAGDMQSLPLFH